MMKALFEGRENLYRGLDIHDIRDWSFTHPVLRLRFGGRYDSPTEIDGEIIARLV